jgi:hypothetical protein
MSAADDLAQALATHDLKAARAAARRMRSVPLPAALGIVWLIYEREHRLYSRAAARWLGRLALERNVTLFDLDEALAAFEQPTRAGRAKLEALAAGQFDGRAKAQ